MEMEEIITITDTRERILELLKNSHRIRNVFPVGDMPHPIVFTVDEIHPFNVLVFDFCEDTLEEANHFVNSLIEKGIKNICHPAGTTHSKWPAHVRRRCGISDSLVWLCIDEMDDLETIEILDSTLHEQKT